MLSIIAFQIQAVAVGWQVYTISGRALDLGLVGLAQFVPMILLTLLVGHTADRHDRRIISSLCQTAESLATATLALGTLAGWLDVPRVLAIVAVIGAARAFEGPTMSALMPSLVPRAMIPQASAWYASATQTAQIVGPAVGGLLFWLAPSTPYVTSAVLFLVAALLLVRGGPDTPRAPARPPRSSRSSPGSSSYATTASCSACSRSISSPFSSAASPRCCRSTRATSSAPGPGASGSCAPHRRQARSRCPCCSRAGRSRAASA